MNKLVGISFDGGFSMSGLYKGAQAEIWKQFRFAFYMYCDFHCLDFALVKASKLDFIQMLYECLQELVVFSYSLKKLSH